MKKVKKKVITATKATRNFADYVHRARYQSVTFVLLRNREPFVCLVLDAEQVCTGLDLAATLAKVKLPTAEARAWHRDLVAARKALKAPVNRRR